MEKATKIITIFFVGVAGWALSMDIIRYTYEHVENMPWIPYTICVGLLVYLPTQRIIEIVINAGSSPR